MGLEKNYLSELSITTLEHDQLQDLTADLSISGAQEKFSVKINEKNKLVFTKTGGQFILKPEMKNFRHPQFSVDNEHLTMRLTSLVFGIDTAKSCIVPLDSQLVYITKRFDVKEDGSRYQMEDFAQLMSVSTIAGKYDRSYEEMANIIEAHVPAATVMKEELFRRSLVNWILGNGDAHLKNYSLIKADTGEYILSPMYDVLNTRIHVNDRDSAISLFATKDVRMDISKDDFITLAQRMTLNMARVENIIEDFSAKYPQIEVLIHNDWPMEDDIRNAYLDIIYQRTQILS